MRKQLMAWALMGIWLLLFSSVGWAAEDSHTQAMAWTPKIAQQLVASGWEYNIASAEEPMVVYSLSFLEINSRFSQVLDSLLQVSESELEEPARWRFSADPQVVELVKKYPLSLVAQLQTGVEDQAAETMMESWLVTVGDKPVRLRLEDLNLQQERAEERVQSRLEILLQPQQIDWQREQVLTAIELSYLGQRGEIADTQTTIWIGPELGEPLALVSQRGDASHQQWRRYFAMYLTATVLMPEQLPKDAAFVSVGDIKALQRLLADKGEVEGTPSELILSLGIAGEQSGGQVSLTHYLPGNHCLELAVDFFGDNFSYQGALGWYLAEGLRLVSSIEESWFQDQGPVLRVGLSDRTTIGEHLSLGLSYLPLQLSLRDNELSVVECGQLLVKVQGEGVEGWYQGEYLAGELNNQIGVRLMLSSAFGIQGAWDEPATSKERISLGVVYRY
ncbi:MAG: hypothetical protein GX030_02875 [Firmicutes bacterium]|nr:hypothetical protein [Bacillota bacterium]